MMLTKKQELFCVNIFQGMTQRDAWINAGYSDKYALVDIDTHACHLANKDKIKTRIDDLRNQAASSAIGTVQEREEILTDIYKETKTYPAHKMQAIDIHNKMTNVYKQEVSLPVDELSEAFVFSLFSRMQANRKQLQEGVDESEGSSQDKEAEPEKA
tara:strand:- start:695 stop:1165 length:471 start_codon:yes stop_codon:yes gene_type:complete